MSETVKYTLAHKSPMSDGTVNTYFSPRPDTLEFVLTTMLRLNSELAQGDTYWTIVPVVTVTEVSL